MARPLKTSKQTVDLAAPVVRVSRIRRDPPPKLKQITIEERSQRDQRMAVLGVTAFTMAIMIILFAVASWAGWTPRAYTLFI